MDDRLPAHFEINGLIRAVQAEGGFATVLATGEKHAGTIMIICCENGTKLRAYERMPQLDGSRAWTLSQAEASDKKHEFAEFCARRQKQDPDLWMIELDIANPERFIGLPNFVS